MGNFRSGGFGGRSRDGDRDRGRSSGGFGRSGGRDRGFSGRDSGRFERRPAQMHDVTCDKCGKECQVPFRPTGDKPVLCSDCFRKKDDSRNNFGSGSNSNVMSLEQFDTINKKLDKILEILDMLEIDEDSDEVDGEDEESDEEDEDIDEDDKETNSK